MNPEYRRFFAHVWAICWPWLWWNLRRLERWQAVTKRDLFISVDKFGNVYVRIVGDAPKPDDLYEYEAPRLMPWERLTAGAGLPEACADDLPCMGSVKGLYGVFYGVLAHHVRGPP